MSCHVVQMMRFSSSSNPSIDPICFFHPKGYPGVQMTDLYPSTGYLTVCCAPVKEVIDNSVGV